MPSKLTVAFSDAAKDIETVTVLEQAGQVAVSLQLKGKLKPRLRELCEAAIREVPLAGVVVTPKEGAVEVLGKPLLETRAAFVPEQPLFLRPDAFAQAHAAGNEALVGAAMAQLEPEAADRILELYCGNGNFSFTMGEKVSEVVAVESSLVSLELAQRAARAGVVQTVRFVHGDAAKVCHGLLKEGREFTRMLLDPPRTGAPGVGKWALGLEVGRVVYIACDAGALARDAKELVYAGYRPLSVQVVDMFPQTHHVEVVMSFERELGKGRP